MTLFSCTLRTAKFQCPWSQARRPPLRSVLRRQEYEFEIVENCQRCGPGVGVGGIWLADVAHWRFAGRRISLCLDSNVAFACSDRVSTYCWEANRVPGSWRIVDSDPRGVCVRPCPCSVVRPAQTAPYGGFCVPTVGTIGCGLESGYGWRSVDAKVAPPAFARLSCGFENQQRSENSVPQADHRVVHLTLLIEAGDFQVQLA